MGYLAEGLTFLIALLDELRNKLGMRRMLLDHGYTVADAIADMIYEAAPHLLGRTPEEAADHLELAKLVLALPHDTTRDLLALVKRMVTQQKAADAIAAKSEGR